MSSDSVGACFLTGVLAIILYALMQYYLFSVDAHGAVPVKARGYCVQGANYFQPRCKTMDLSNYGIVLSGCSGMAADDKLYNPTNVYECDL